MASSLSDILNLRQPSQPDEVLVIKKFVKLHFKSDCRVTLSDSLIVIGVKSASLAGALRIKLHELQKQANTTKRITIRIY